MLLGAGSTCFVNYLYSNYSESFRNLIVLPGISDYRRSVFVLFLDFFFTDYPELLLDLLARGYTERFL